MSPNYRLTISILAGFVLIAASCWAQHVQYGNVPDRVLTALGTGANEKIYSISESMNPFYLRGDFDGDGKPDYAVWIIAKKDHAKGIAICLSSQKQIYVIGAGNSFALPNSITNLSFINEWKVYDKGSVERGVEAGNPPRLLGDAILIGKSESASGLIYWTGKKFAWYQQGD